MRPHYRLRRALLGLMLLMSACLIIISNSDFYSVQVPLEPEKVVNIQPSPQPDTALTALSTLPIKGRAPKTDYSRAQFGAGWQSTAGCDTRNQILYRDLESVTLDESCKVLSGVLNDPYTAGILTFTRGASTSSQVQIDHVVALSDAWQKGAQQLTAVERVTMANDPLELLAVEGKANQEKSDGDAATWLPANKPFRCQYVARQVAVKQKYRLWVTVAEHDAIKRILDTCPAQRLPVAQYTVQVVS